MSQDCYDIRQDVLFIGAGCQRTELNDDPQHFAAMPPYRNKNLFTRILREAWFRLHLPFKELWYNKEVETFTGKHLIV